MMQTKVKTFRVTVIWRGRGLIVEIDSGATLQEFGKELQKMTNVKADTMRLIVPQCVTKTPRLLSPFSDEHAHVNLLDISTPEGKFMRMMGVPESEVNGVLQNAKANLRIAGFNEEEMRLRKRMQEGPHAPLKLPQGTYVFCDFRTLQLPGVELHPPATEALKRMHMLAADPGIVAIMNKHCWRVGIMTEMAPVGYVGVSPRCILGLNKNQGEEISLRLRTDDLKGFRKYESIKKTLLHELAHMVYSEHDANFYALDRQLNEEAATLDWTKSKSRTLGVKHANHQEEDLFLEEPNIVAHKLGGKSSNQFGSARTASAVAAYGRSSSASMSNSGVANFYFRKGRNSGPTKFLSMEKLVLDSPAPNKSFEFFDPDSDDSSRYLDELKNGNSKVSEVMESEPHFKNDAVSSDFGSNVDDVKMKQIVPQATELASTCEEPGPDDSLNLAHSGLDYVTRIEDIDIQMRQADPTIEFGAEQENLRERDIRDYNGCPVNSTNEDQTESRNSIEPDPDDSSGDFMQAGPYPDDMLVPDSERNRQADEPDPDDQELQRIQDPVSIVCTRLQKSIGMLKSEASSTEVTSVLQTLTKIIRNLVEHPEETKFKKLRMANPVIQKNVANHKAAMEILSLAGFIEDTIFDEAGMTETFLVLKRNDPGLLWLVKSFLETGAAH